MYSPERIAHLLFKHFHFTITAQETKELESWKSAAPENEAAFREFTDAGYVYNLYSELYTRKRPEQPVKKRMFLGRLLKRKDKKGWGFLK